LPTPLSLVLQPNFIEFCNTSYCKWEEHFQVCPYRKVSCNWCGEICVFNELKKEHKYNYFRRSLATGRTFHMA